MSNTSTTTTLLSVLAFLLPWTGVAVSGWSAFNQACSPYHDAYNDYCDPFAFLKCERSLHGRSNDYICKCSSPEYVWASLVGRCTLRVDSSCFQGPLGRGSLNDKIPGCPPQSYCDIRGSYTCKCNTNHVPNADGSACNEGIRLEQRGAMFFSSAWLLQLNTMLPCATLLSRRFLWG